MIFAILLPGFASAELVPLSAGLCQAKKVDLVHISAYCQGVDFPVVDSSWYQWLGGEGLVNIDGDNAYISGTSHLLSTGVATAVLPVYLVDSGKISVFNSLQVPCDCLSSRREDWLRIYGDELADLKSSTIAKYIPKFCPPRPELSPHWNLLPLIDISWPESQSIDEILVQLSNSETISHTPKRDYA